MEKWKSILGYEGLYEVSSIGRVRSVKKCINPKKERKIIVLTKSNKGYVLVNLYKNGIRVKKNVHRLLAEVFISNPENKPQTNHKNGIKWDNRVENLEWVTGSENQRHAVINGLKPKTYKKHSSFCNSIEQ